MRQSLNAAALNSTLELGRFMDYVFNWDKKKPKMYELILEFVYVAKWGYHINVHDFSLGEDSIIRNSMKETPFLITNLPIFSSEVVI